MILEIYHSTSYTVFSNKTNKPGATPIWWFSLIYICTQNRCNALLCIAWVLWHYVAWLCIAMICVAWQKQGERAVTCYGLLVQVKLCYHMLRCASKAAEEKARQDKESQGKASQGKAKQGKAKQGNAMQAMLSKAKQGKAKQNQA